MKRAIWLIVLMVGMLLPQSAAAQTRFVVRNSLGGLVMNLTCGLLGCKVVGGLGDPNGQLFLVTSNTDNVVLFLLRLLLSPGVKNAEVDVKGEVLAANAGAVPESFYDRAPMSYYGTNVWHGYVYQPANQIVRTLEAQSTFGVDGTGTIVAIIDTGVDVDHPVLKPALVAGYDFTRNKSNGNEKGDVSQSTAALLDDAQPAYVNQSTAALLDQSTAALLDNPQYASFGHGTMTAGVVHLVAPRAKIMPLQAFGANGEGYVSDVMRAVYHATKNGAKVINMSFSFSSYSPELNNAVNYASGRGVVCVGSAGNDGLETIVYPAGLDNVIGVASTTDFDTRSTFSNYGNSLVWVAAPGEAVITTYPYGTYAAVWGTSFSTPFVAGTAALLNDVSSSVNEDKAETAVGNAKWVDPDLNKGRLDVYEAVKAWRRALGLN
jgi:subtilisin family serine protease